MLPVRDRPWIGVFWALLSNGSLSALAVLLLALQIHTKKNQLGEIVHVKPSENVLVIHW